MGLRRRLSMYGYLGFAALSAMTLRQVHPVTKYVFDASLLELRPTSSDRVGLRLAIEQCDRELRELALIGGISERVRTLCCKHDGMRSLKEVAAQLELSTRTLNRRLAAEGVLFSQLLDGERLRRAQLFLRTTELSLSEIGVKLGYSTLPNFARAFRRWTGKTPEEYRLAARSRQREREARDAAPAGAE